jgi:regulatory protein
METPEASKAVSRALKILSRRDHSEAELVRKLSLKGFSPESVTAAIEKLRQAGYLDDGRFARVYAESAIRNGRGYGFRLRLELSRRGVDEDTIAETLERLGAEYGELETLSGLMAGRFPDFDPLESDDRLKRRVMGYFQRRGFSLAAIVRVMREMEG